MLVSLTNLIFVSSHIIVTLKSPAIGVFSNFEQGHPSRTLLRNRIRPILTIHIFLCEVTRLIIEILTIQRQNLRINTDVQLFLQLRRVIPIDKRSLPASMRMHIHTSEEPFCIV